MSYQSNLSTAQPKIKAFVFSRVTNHGDALDVIQDVNRVILEKESVFDNSKDFAAWAMGITRFQILAYLTKIKRTKTVSFDTLLEGEMQEKNGICDLAEGDFDPIDATIWELDSPVDCLVDEEMNSLLLKITKALTPPQQKIFYLLCKGFSNPQICKKLNLPYAIVTAHKTRLIAKARAYLKSIHSTNKYDYRERK